MSLEAFPLPEVHWFELLVCLSHITSLSISCSNNDLFLHLQSALKASNLHSLTPISFRLSLERPTATTLARKASTKMEKDNNDTYLYLSWELFVNRNYPAVENVEREERKASSKTGNEDQSTHSSFLPPSTWLWLQSAVTYHPIYNFPSCNVCFHSWQTYTL